MTVKEWLVKTLDSVKCPLPMPRPRVLCADGFSISIQANQWVYCIPRKLLSNCEYTHVELGYASEYEELLDEYKEGPVYPYVPMEVVEKVIEKHGGIVGGSARWED